MAKPYRFGHESTYAVLDRKKEIEKGPSVIHHLALTTDGLEAFVRSEGNDNKPDYLSGVVATQCKLVGTNNAAKNRFYKRYHPR